LRYLTVSHGSTALFFETFSLTARMFYSGLLCGSSADQESEHAGHLHVLRKGKLKITRPNARQMVIDTLSILFFPRPSSSRPRARGSRARGRDDRIWRRNVKSSHRVVSRTTCASARRPSRTWTDPAAFVFGGFLRITMPPNKPSPPFSPVLPQRNIGRSKPVIHSIAALAKPGIARCDGANAPRRAYHSMDHD
jgi:hypothetical protein